MNGSPEVEYFRPLQQQQQQQTRRASRWKEDWEELELLVSVPPGFSSSLSFVLLALWYGRAKAPLDLSSKRGIKLIRGYMPVRPLSSFSSTRNIVINDDWGWTMDK